MRFDDTSAHAWHIPYAPLPSAKSIADEIQRRVALRDASEPWTLIDSEEVARTFIGKRVEVDAPGGRDLEYAEHNHHGQAVVITNADAPYLWYGNESGFPVGIDWVGRGNVRLRVVSE